MESSYSFPQDDYALTILTQAAMHTSSNDQFGYQYQRRPASTGAGNTGPSSSMPITNHSDRGASSNNVPHPTNISSVAHEYNPTGRSQHSMDTLNYGADQSGRGQNSYMNPTSAYHGISSSYGNNLGILNAESYDDGRGALRAREASAQRMKEQPERIMPFGITDVPGARMDAVETDEGEGGGRRRKRPRIESHSGDDEEEARKTARGRPRVDTKDETAADRRRTQIRMAQRAYRHRKETIISSLEKQVQDLRGTNEEMSNIFIKLYDFAVGKGLLQREPEFGQQLQSTTERFLALAKASTNDDSAHEDNHAEDSGKQNSVEPENSKRSKSRKVSPKKTKQQEPTPPVSEPTNPWGGYSIAKDDSPVGEVPVDYHNSFENKRNGDLQVITRPTEDNASFPFDFMDLQQFRVEVPPVNDFVNDFSQPFFLKSQPPLPKASNHNEVSFARRLHRTSIEKALKFISMDNPPEDRLRKIWGITLMYRTKEEIKETCKKILEKSNNDTLHLWRSPFSHIGGAGTFYPMRDPELNGDLMPKFKTGYSMGPFTSRASEAQDTMKDDLRCTLPGFEGDFFDANDVDGYLRGHGIKISPTADFVTAELDLAAFAEPLSPKSTRSTISTSSPKTPQSPVDTFVSNETNPFDTFSLDYSKADTFSLGYENWDVSMPEKDVANIDPILAFLGDQEASNKPTDSSTTKPQKNIVTINVATFLEELTSRGVCLGRSPGFRPSDVNVALIAAVKAGFSS